MHLLVGNVLLGENFSISRELVTAAAAAYAVVCIFKKQVITVLLLIPNSRYLVLFEAPWL
jgi:hypothetical protein